MKSDFVILPSGLRLHYGHAGDPAASPLLLVHGYPASHLLWRHSAPELSRHFKVLAPDLPGHGLSDKPADAVYDLDFFVGAMRGFVDVLGLDRFGLVVHDLGAMVGLGFAARHPDRVERLVVMDTAPYARWPLLNRLVVAVARSRWGARSLASRAGFGRALRLFCVHDPEAITDEVVELYRRPWAADEAGRRALRQVVAQPAARLTEPREHLARITMPTLVLWAEHDLVLPARLGRRLARDLPRASFTLVRGCGHFLQEERPAEVTGHLLRFLTEAP